jgi:hypothetical protein
VDRSNLFESLPSLKNDLVAAERRVVEAQWEVDALRAIIRGIERLRAGDQMELPVFGNVTIAVSEVEPDEAPEVRESEGPVSEEAPRGRAAVRAVVANGRPWKQQAIIAEIKRRGWIRPNASNPDGAIREAVRRLWKDGELERIAHATYQLVPPEGDGGDSG